MMEIKLLTNTDDNKEWAQKKLDLHFSLYKFYINIKKELNPQYYLMLA